MSEALRTKLVEAGRVLAFEGQGDYVAGHVSVRLPDGSGSFLMKPAGVGLEEMTHDNIIVVDTNGERVGGDMPRHNEVFIHSEILRVRADVNAVVHTHPSHAVAFSSLGRPFVPMSCDATIFPELPIFSETTDLIINKQRGEAVARCLAANHALILQNHGVVTVGASIEEAVYYAIKLEKACRIQMLAEMAGGPVRFGAALDTAKKGARNRRADLYGNVFDYVARCACRAEGQEISCEDIKPREMQGKFSA